MALFDSLKDNNHQVRMDNLYKSAAFCRATYHHDCKFLCHGVAYKAGRGIPEGVLQDEVKNPVAQQGARSTVKAAVLEEYPGCANLIASSVYNTKPVHYLIMVSESIQWLYKEKIVYNNETGKVEALKFLRLNQIDKYNNGMGDFDVVDQLRGVYRLDCWVRNRKWWWSMLFWYMGVLLKKYYKFYLHMCKEEGMKPRYNEQYQFQKTIAEYWINPESVTSEKESKKRKFDFEIPSPSTFSTISLLSPGTSTCTTIVTDRSSRQRSSSVENASMEPTERLSLRMNRSVDIIIDKDKKKSRCALHYWSSGIRYKGQILACLSCNISMCTKYYVLFHRVHYLNSNKHRIKNDILNDIERAGR